ncbi:hypothetical protein [Catenovulum agarivorans]|uniref:hypothetical protein n=1 Tax=Catenovulum agarivorans TaxID=1172192 RepID=UPI0012692461|nr:hypothetical protein [Catenovulum agarivorans]
MIVYFILLLLWIGLYKKQANHEQFYQVSAAKFVLMNTLTLGMFSAYWFYRNFKHIQFTYEQDISPVWRAIFFIFFIHSLWTQVQKNSIRKIASDRLLVYSIAMGLTCLLINISSEFDIGVFFVFTDLAIAIVLLPLLNAVNQLEQQGSVKQGITSNSTFNGFHIGVASAYLFMTVFTVTEFFNLTPQNKVVEGKKLWHHDINMMVNKGIVQPKEPIKLFYSDALVWFKADGNGFTEQRVFSYWVLEGVFYSEVAEYQNIANIKVEWGEDDENSVITITRTDNSEFYLYVSSLDGKDKEFESKLRALWQVNNKLPS